MYRTWIFSQETTSSRSSPTHKIRIWHYC